MNPKRREGPFQPGAGGLPPCLAGRDEEQDALIRRLNELAAHTPRAENVILIGPRGNGKTVLLRWVEGYASRGRRFEVLRRTPRQMRTEEALVESLGGGGWRERFRHAKLAIEAGTGVAKGRIEVGGSANRGGGLGAALAARAKRKPLIVLLDEAHTLDEEVGATLLDASQEAAGAAPFLLVAAGTPVLEERLRSMNATFWDRARHHPIGRIGAGAAETAIRVPLEKEGIRIEEEALRRIVRASQGYPYFVQILGEEVWKEIEGEGTVTCATVSAAQARFERRRDMYHGIRYRELGKRGVLGAARALAEAFAGRAELGEDELEAAMVDVTGAKAREQTLEELGYIWRPAYQPRWEPGIPSLMDYVLSSGRGDRGGRGGEGSRSPRRFPADRPRHAP